MTDVVEKLRETPNVKAFDRSLAEWRKLGEEAATEIETLRVRLSQAGAGGVVVKPLEWSDAAPPNAEYRYDHVVTETPFGSFSIEWKSWKPHDSFTVYHNGAFLLNGRTLDEAKAAAQADFEYRIRSALAATPPAPVQTASVEAVAFPAYGEMPFSELGSAVKAAQFGSLQPYEFDPEFYPGHQIVGTINFNSLNRIVTWFVKRALASFTAPTQGDGDETLWCESCGEATVSVRLDVAGLCADCAKEQGE